MGISMFALTDKVAIVTGGGRGIGRAIALGFARAGADVVVAARTAAEIEDTAALVRREGRKALAVPTDVQDADQVKNLLSQTMDAFSRIDILVNNAGGNIFSNVLDMSVEFWENIVKQNLTSTFLCSRIIGEAMVKQKSGNIINMSSVTASSPLPRGAAYGAAKAGIISLTQTLAVEWAPYHVRVNAIAPGIIITPLSRQLAPETSPYRQAQLKRIPLGRFGKPEDVVGAAIFLASDASAYITGATIPVDGAITTTVFDT